MTLPSSWDQDGSVQWMLSAFHTSNVTPMKSQVFFHLLLKGTLEKFGLTKLMEKKAQ
jgi:hypothetical protein